MNRSVSAPALDLYEIEPVSGMASIIIPNFNHARYLGDAIRSVLCQDYSNFEVIVVDDGSTDNSREVAAQFGEQIRYIWQENQGLSAARNTGIRASSGSYIGVLDADDMYEPDYLSTMIAVLQADPAAAGVFCGYQFVDDGNSPLPQVESRPIPDTGLYRALLDGNFLVPEAMFLKRECFGTGGGFDPTLTACEDWDMWLRISREHKIIGTPKVLTRHRILPGSMSTDPVRMLKNRLAVLGKHLGPEPSGDEPVNQLARRAYGRVYLSSCVEYLQYGNPERAYECLNSMAHACPALMTELDTFYQLGCGDQPKGAMGDFASLDLQRNAQVLFAMLDRLYESKDLPGKIISQRRAAYSNASFAMALLSYGAGHFKIARRFLLSTLKSNWQFASRRKFASIFIKSYFGASLIERIRATRQTAAPS